MASLKKLGARKPVIAEAGLWLGDECLWEKGEPEDGHLHFAGYAHTLTVTGTRAHPLSPRTEYVVTMSEDEAFHIAVQILERRRNRMLNEQRRLEDAARRTA